MEGSRETGSSSRRHVAKQAVLVGDMSRNRVFSRDGALRDRVEVSNVVCFFLSFLCSCGDTEKIPTYEASERVRNQQEASCFFQDTHL